MRTCAYTVILLLGCAASMAAQRSYDGSLRLTVDVPQKIASRAGEESVWTYTVSDSEGRKITEVNRAIPYDVPAPSPLVFGDGRILLLHSFDAFAEVYDASGERARRVPLVAEPTPDYERVIRAAVHRTVALLAVSERAGGVRVLEIDSDGNLRLRRTLEGLLTTGVAVADEPSVIAVGTMRWVGDRPVYETTVMEGEETWKVPVGFKAGRFVSGGRFIGFDDSGVFALQRSARTVEWTVQAGDGRLVVDVLPTAGRISILTADRPKWFEGGWIYTEPAVRTVSMTGKTVTERTIPRPSFSKGNLSLESGSVVVRLDGRVAE